MTRSSGTQAQRHDNMCDCENWKTQRTTEGACRLYLVCRNSEHFIAPAPLSKPTAIDFSSFAIRARKLPDKFVLAGSGRTTINVRSFVVDLKRKPGRFKLSRNSATLFVDQVTARHYRLLSHIVLSIVVDIYSYVMLSSWLTWSMLK